ncbi:MAG: hypothetical protein IPL53_15590 [Ignavibacteria bacterium]|nr:hypothetical protein [Ignavibacteria bacterium]
MKHQNPLMSYLQRRLSLLPQWLIVLRLIQNILFFVIVFFCSSVFSGRSKMPISDLYNTGQDSRRYTLADGSTDEHYFLTNSADKNFLGPEARVSLSTGFPMDRWVPNNEFSKWISPRTDAVNFNESGLYVYRTQFDLSKFKYETAEIRGLWSTDNNGVNILINGKSTGFFTPTNAYYGMFPFEITEGFTEGINTLDFIVYNINAPTGIRVEINGQAEPKEYVFGN